mmetsp:Transcript_5237/g.20363  ORF Transcript_5237/g.20363 Transcript_5237/m.20363 type:complete len:200 (-) Transcript_5237:1815-2414(-)
MATRATHRVSTASTHRVLSPTSIVTERTFGACLWRGVVNFGGDAPVALASIASASTPGVFCFASITHAPLTTVFTKSYVALAVQSNVNARAMAGLDSRCSTTRRVRDAPARANTTRERENDASEMCVKTSGCGDNAVQCTPAFARMKTTVYAHAEASVMIEILAPRRHDAESSFATAPGTKKLHVMATKIPTTAPPMAS